MRKYIIDLTVYDDNTKFDFIVNKFNSINGPLWTRYEISANGDIINGKPVFEYAWFIGAEDWELDEHQYIINDINYFFPGLIIQLEKELQDIVK